MDEAEFRLKSALGFKGPDVPSQDDVRTVMGWSRGQEFVILDDAQCVMFSSLPYYTGRQVRDWREELRIRGILCIDMSDITDETWTYDEVWWCFQGWERNSDWSCFARFFSDVVSEGYRELAMPRLPKPEEVIIVFEERVLRTAANTMYQYIFWDLLQFATMDMDNYDDFLFHDMALNVKPYYFKTSPVWEGTATQAHWRDHQIEEERRKYEQLGAKPKTKHNALTHDSGGWTKEETTVVNEELTTSITTVSTKEQQAAVDPISDSDGPERNENKANGASKNAEVAVARADNEQAGGQTPLRTIEGEAAKADDEALGPQGDSAPAPHELIGEASAAPESEPISAPPSRDTEEKGEPSKPTLETIVEETEEAQSSDFDYDTALPWSDESPPPSEKDDSSSTHTTINRRPVGEAYPVRNFKPITPKAEIWWTNGRLEGRLTEVDGSTNEEWDPTHYLRRLVHQADIDRQEEQSQHETLHMVRDRANTQMCKRLSWAKQQLRKIVSTMKSKRGRQSLLCNLAERTLTIRAISEYRRVAYTVEVYRELRLFPNAQLRTYEAAVADIDVLLARLDLQDLVLPADPLGYRPTTQLEPILNKVPIWVVNDKVMTGEPTSENGLYTRVPAARSALEAVRETSWIREFWLERSEYDYEDWDD